MQFCTAELRRGAFGQPSVPFLLSRRAHLLTTPKGRWYCQRLYRFGNRALCEADAAPAGALWTMPHHGGAAVIVHADGYVFCFIIKTVVSVLETTCRLPVKICRRQFYRSYGYRSCDTHFLFAKKKQKAEGRKDGENEWRFTTWKPRWSAEVRDGLRLPLPLI